MKVQTKFEIKHFIKYVNENLAPVTMDIIDYTDNFFKTIVNGENFHIHEDILTFIQTRCPAMKSVYKVLQ